MKRIALLHATAILTIMLTFACNKTEKGFSVPDGTKLNAEISLADISFPSGKTLNLTHGIGSGAFRLSSDPEGVIYTVSDRGPNIDCKADEKLIGKDMCKKGKIFPVPSFAPSIYKYKITADKAELLERITLKDEAGKDITGLSNPFVATDTEMAFDQNGNPIEYDPSGLDTEGIVKLSDGTFWLADEYGPSIIHVAANGNIIEMLVPAGLEPDLRDAKYPVKGTLPAILMKRKLNRGIESVAVDPEERHLYFIMQSPLANPDTKAYKASAMARVFKMSLTDGKVIAEYAYRMDKPEAFIKDNAKKKQKQNGVKLSEMTGLEEDRILVLERISASTKLYEIDLTEADNILGSKWDSIQTNPSLEVSQPAEIKAVSKKIVFDSDNYDGLPEKVEGIALMKNNKAVLVNDNDFGIAGAGSEFTIVTLPIGR